MVDSRPHDPEERREDMDSVERAADAGDYIERVRRLAPEIAACADRIERDRRLPEELVEKLLAAGFYRLLLPRSCGGAEIDLVTFAKIMEEIGRIDASTAWCVCQCEGTANGMAISLRPEVASEIFGRDRRAIAAWGPAPDGRAIAVDGGYRVSGRWMFASGGRNATWLGCHSFVHEADGTPRRHADGSPVVRTMIVPAASVEMSDVWHVMGLRGTGSDAYAVNDLFVPEERSIDREYLAERRQPGALFSFPIGLVYAAGFAGIALGIARALLDAFIELACGKTPSGRKLALRDDNVVQLQVAQAEAQYRASRLLLWDAYGAAFRAAAADGRLSVAQRIDLRLAASHAIQQAVAIADTAYHAAGATAIFTSNPFERRFRDIHTLAQQQQGRLAHFQSVGKHMLGLEPDLYST